MKPLFTTRQPRGFTLLEVIIVSALMAFLAVLLSAAWSGLGRPAVDTAARCRVVQEANLVVASLARDLGGSLADDEGRTGSQARHLFVGRMQPGGSQLRLCYDGGTQPNGIADWGTPDTVITYEVQSNQLVRWNETSGTVFIAARHVDQWELEGRGNEVEINLTFKYRDIIRTYNLIAKDP